MGPPRRVPVVVWAVVAVALVTAAVVVSRADLPPDRHDLLTAALLAALIGLGRAFPVQLGPRTQVVVDHAVAFAAVLLLPPYRAVGATVAGLAAVAIVWPSIVLRSSRAPSRA